MYKCVWVLFAWYSYKLCKKDRRRVCGLLIKWTIYAHVVCVWFVFLCLARSEESSKWYVHCFCFTNFTLFFSEKECCFMLFGTINRQNVFVIKRLFIYKYAVCIYETNEFFIWKTPENDMKVQYFPQFLLWFTSLSLDVYLNQKHVF